jgi:hypothetical protein
MKKVICKVEYDTNNAEIVAKFTRGVIGDPKGYEETLYKTAEGKIFVYENGGADSIHPEENIKRLGANKVDEWKNERGL